MAGRIWRYGRVFDAEMTDLAEQNRRLRKIFAEMSLQNELL